MIYFLNKIFMRFGYRFIKIDYEQQQNAIAKRVDTTKQKIINAIKELQSEDKKITEYAISKQSKCSINTIKKYRDIIKELVCTDTK